MLDIFFNMRNGKKKCFSEPKLHILDSNYILLGYTELRFLELC